MKGNGRKWKEMKGNERKCKDMKGKRMTDLKGNRRK